MSANINLSQLLEEDLHYNQAGHKVWKLGNITFYFPFLLLGL